MNTTINFIRRNWLLLTLSLLLLTIYISRHTGTHPLSWWNTCWIVLPFYVAGVAAGTNWAIFRPLRWLTWPNMCIHVEKKFKALDSENMMLYPALIWLKLGDAERAYITGGMPALLKAFDEQTNKLMDALTDVVKKAGDKKTDCACGDTGCGCHDSALDEAIEKGFMQPASQVTDAI